MNLLSPLPDARVAEQVATLLTRPGLRVERIVSQGQASPPGFWYDQAEGEWVLMLAGAARLRFADEPESRLLRAGDSLDIAPHRRHRVDWTDPASPSPFSIVNTHPSPSDPNPMAFSDTGWLGEECEDSTIWQRTGRIDDGVMSVLLTDPLLSPILVVLRP